MTDPSVLRVTQVVTPSDALLGADIQMPRTGERPAGFAMKVSGWVVGRHLPVKTIELMVDGKVIKSAKVELARPVVGERFSTVPWAERSGFMTLAGTIGLGAPFELGVRAVFLNGSRAPLAAISGFTEPVPTSFTPTMQPLMVTSLGRTGTTWLMRVLAEHPQIVAYRRYPYEVLTSKYWMHVLRVLSQPGDPEQRIGQPNSFHEEKSQIGGNPFHAAAFTEYTEVENFFKYEYPQRILKFAQESTESFYRSVAHAQNQPAARYFVEKHLPDEYPPLIWQLYPQARELILVRDFRDMASSALAFNARRGFNDFGRQRVDSDEQWIVNLKRGATKILTSWQTRAESAHLIRYEDLIQQPLPTLTAVAEYLGIDQSPATLSETLTRAQEDTPELERHRTSESATASIGRWRRDLDPSLRPIAAESFNEALSAFGYEID
ncbi:MAG: sulfotransferase [Thermomicrobiales bacterium]|nr:sulfotransferase [Thermomicrobiales bacterium]